ncbi:hypothetical protein Geob_0572 [Geotalea daltonii FRC-32]|uniref:Lipoprotein n=1 Tax=Geotalea daltonii (strain DSM 22248 / JCM 15807 / FRC-32) TaxID=316067 RepID=B9LZX5_GEODF|nr:hypothetical protein [Geotalea daltonii]ACM18939.1 hypothetical protein Geob_0572 [Geotalea daltonii FRC-32]
MKKYMIIAAAVVFGAALSYVLLAAGGGKALNVNEISSDPGAYAGTITVTGVMGGTSPQDPTIFGIMDIKELQCKTANCNKVFVPIKYQGKPPVMGDEIRATGKFVNMAGGYLFAAEKLKVVRNHKIGG